MATFNCIVTNAGRNLIATAMSGGQTVNLINVKTGNGQIGAGNAYNLTALINDIQDYPIDGSNSLTPYQTSVQFTVNSANVPTSYQMYEAGLMAKIGTNGTPTLLWYGYTTAPDTITPSGSSNATIDVNQLAIVYSNATSCVATQTPTVTVPPHAVTHLDNGFDPIPVSSTTRTGLLTQLSGLVGDVFRGNGTWSNLAALVNAIVFPHATKHISTGSDPIPVPSTTASGLVLANPNDVTQVYCGSNPPSWQTGLLVIKSNVTLYVATNGNDSTALAYLKSNFPTINNNSSAPFATVQAALNWLASYFILPSNIVTINVAAGVYNIATGITIDHPQASQINIIGVIGSIITTTSASSSAGTVTLTQSGGGFSGISAGDYIMVSCTTVSGAGNSQAGTVRVATANSTTITYQNNTASISLASINFYVQKVSTVFLFGSGISGFLISSGIGLLQNIALIGSGSNTIGVSTNGGICNLDHIAFIGWTNSGLSTSGNCQTSLNLCFASKSNNAFQCQGFAASINAASCYAIFNYIGFRNLTSNMFLSGCWSVSNSFQGSTAGNGGAITLTGNPSYFCYNLTGIYLGAGYLFGGTIVASQFVLNTTDVSMTVQSIFWRDFGAAIAYSSTSIGAGCVFSP